MAVISGHFGRGTDPYFFLHCYDTIRYDTLLMHKAIMAHEHINKYKYNTVQYRIARYTKHNTVAIQ